MMRSDSITRRYLYILFALAVGAVVFSVLLMALIAGFGYLGYDGNTQISATCPVSPIYWIVKYSQIGMIQEICFIFSILCAAASIAFFLLLLRSLIGAKHSEQAQIFIPISIKVTLYVLASVAIMCAIPPFGYYISIVAEINNCSPASYDNSKISAVLAMAVILLAVLLVLFVLLFVSFCSSSEEKYREVSHQHTEPNEQVRRTQEVKHFQKKHLEREQPYKKNPEVYEKRTPQEMEKNSPPKRINRAEDLEQTKEHLYSPSRQPTIQTYSKEVDPRPLLRPEPRNEPQKQPAPILQPKQPAPILQPKQPAPVLQPREKYAYSPSKYTSPSRQNDGELMFHKPRRVAVGNDEEEFSREQNRYLSRNADRPILSSGVKEVNTRERPMEAGFTRAQLPQENRENRNQAVGRTRGQRNLLNFIRGKYA